MRASPGDRNSGRAAVALPSLDAESVYQEALRLVRSRRQNGEVGYALGKPAKVSPRTERAETAGQLVPKYLRLTCILRPETAQAPPEPPPRSSRVRRLAAPVEGVDPPSWPELRAALGLTVCFGSRPLTLVASLGELRLPAGVWLVLDPLPAQRVASQETLASEGDLPLGSKPGAGKAWVAEKSVPFLQLLEEDQLTLPAAEANFTRCTRGASFLALKHGAFVLKALATKQSLQTKEGGPPLQQTLEEIDAKVSRAAGLVGSRAAAALSRRKERPKGEAPEATDAAPGTPCGRSSAAWRGFQALLDFRGFAGRKYGNCVRLWFILDPEENLRLAERQFMRSCEDLGFAGCMGSLWRQLDPEGTGQVCLHDLDPVAAQQLAEFKVLLQQFDGGAEGFMKTVELNRSQRAGREEFARAASSAGYEGSGKKLFELLCRLNASTVSVQDLRFLRKWSPPVYFCTRPGQLHAFRSALTELHGNPLRAWFRVLDPDQSLRVTFRSFLRCRLPRSLRLQTEEEMAAVWRAMDTQCQGSCGLRHFSPEAHEAAAGLRRHAAQHGGCAKLLAKLEAQGQVTKPIFRKALAEALNHSAADLLFEGLDVGDTGHIGEQEVRCLDKWDLPQEELRARAEAKSQGR